MPQQVRASLWFVICGFLQRGISTLTTPIFTRLLSTAEFGDYNAFSSWLEIITVFATLRLGFGVFMQGCVKFEEDRDRFASALLSLATTWWLGFLCIYLVGFRFWNNLLSLNTFEVLCMFAMMISTVAFNFWSVKKRIDFDYVPLVKLTLLVALLKPAFGIAAVLLFPEHKVEARIGSLALVELLCYSGLYISTKNKSRTWFHKFYWKYAVSYNIPLVPHFLSQTILNHSDRLMIKTMVDSDAAGIYSLAYSISLIMTMINTSIQNTLNPWIYIQIKAKKFQAIAKVAYIILIVVAFANFMLICFAPEIIYIFAPRAYHEAVYVIPPVAMGCYFLFMYCLFADFELYQAKTMYMMIASVISAVLNLVLNYLFIPMFGYIAAAYTTLVCYMIYAFIHFLFMRRICRRVYGNVKVYDMRIILFITGIFLVSGFIIMSFYERVYVRYAIVLFVVGIMFVKRNKILMAVKPLIDSKNR